MSFFCASVSFLSTLILVYPDSRTGGVTFPVGAPVAGVLEFGVTGVSPAWPHAPTARQPISTAPPTIAKRTPNLPPAARHRAFTISDECTHLKGASHHNSLHAGCPIHAALLAAWVGRHNAGYPFRPQSHRETAGKQAPNTPPLHPIHTMELEAMNEPTQLEAATGTVTDARAFLRITGPDATRWLNGMVTNSIRDLAPGQGNYNFLLNAQGRIQGDCTIYREPTEGDPIFLLVTGATQLETIRTLLDKFIIMDDVELTPIPAEAVPASIREQLPAPLTEPDRILAGTPKFGQDIRTTDLPQETSQTHALHFNKGCYLGQEIVERIRSRGQVHRQLAQFTLSAEPASLPVELTAPGEAPAAGRITSTALYQGTHYGLGIARAEALERHPALDFPGGTATRLAHSPLTSS